MLIAATLVMVLNSCGQSDDLAEAQGSLTGLSESSPAPVDDRTVTTVKAVSPAAGAATPLERSAGTDSGESVYRKACIGCHLSGAAGAPRLGDKPAWVERIGKGTDVLVRSAIIGVPGTAMLARGTCVSCSDDEIEAAVAYMISQSQ